jgi:hypothetical protein
MSGKGSKRRPQQVSDDIVDAHWDMIFGGKNVKHEHSRGIITEKISQHWSDNGKREAIVVRTEKGYMVELYEQSRYIRTVDVTQKSLQYAEDTAENWALGVL